MVLSRYVACAAMLVALMSVAGPGRSEKTSLHVDTGTAAVSEDGTVAAGQHNSSSPGEFTDEQRQALPTRRPWTGDQPPKPMPEDLVWAYTRCGTIGTAEYFVDDSNGGKGTTIVYSRSDIDSFIQYWEGFVDADASRLKRLGKDRWLVEVHGRVTMRRAAGSPHHRAWQALQKHPIQGKRAVVFGSIDPRIEALCLAFGAIGVTTVEYNSITLDHPSIVTVTPEEFDTMRDSYDVALSMSSFDHDGLGRYGDPLCPDGDLLSMNMVRRHLVPGGLLFLTVPIGEDVVVWNLHRRYGEIRLPLLIAGWDVVERVGWREGMLKHKGRINQSYEPVFVLRY